MFGRNNAELPYEYTSEFHSQFPLPDAAAQVFPPPPLLIPEHDCLSALRSEVGYASSGCSSYGGSPTSYGVMQRSTSSHSLNKNLEAYSPMNFSPTEYGGEMSSFRKVLSAGDLQTQSQNQNQRSPSPLVNENSIIESMNRVSPYSPEEKRERIERYRSKRNLRNFNKKIKYECRKTLADSRPRIRGRFARNEEMEKAPQSQWDHATVDQYDKNDDNWINFLDALSTNLMP